MHSKSNKRCRNINGQPLDTQTPNNPQNPHSPYIYDLPSDNGVNANVSLQDGLLAEATSSKAASSNHVRFLESKSPCHERCSESIPAQGQSSEQPFTDNASFLESTTKCQKRWSKNLSPNDVDQSQDITRNVRQRFASDDCFIQSTVESSYVSRAEAVNSSKIGEASQGARRQTPLHNSAYKENHRPASLPHHANSNEDSHYGNPTTTPNQRRQASHTKGGGDSHNVCQRVSSQDLGCLSANSAYPSGESPSVLVNQENQQRGSPLNSSQPLQHRQTRAQRKPRQYSTQRRLYFEDHGVMSNQENQRPTSMANVVANAADFSKSSEVENRPASTQQSTKVSHRESGGKSRNVRRRVQSTNFETAFDYVSRRVRPQNFEAASSEGADPSGEGAGVLANLDVSPSYEDLGDCDQRCRRCRAAFWYEECVLRDSNNIRTEYHLCCGDGRIIMAQQPNPPQYIKDLLSDARFMENIRAYNQMFAMTSFGATIDKSVNAGPGPYVFKVSGQIYHWIGSLCPLGNTTPRFLQLYIYNTHKEVQNRLSHFSNSEQDALDPQIVQGLIHFLDTHNELVKFLRTARDLCSQADIPEFNIRLYNGRGARGYELPTSNTLGAIVFDSGPISESDYDVIIQYKGSQPQRINKLHQSYMSLQFPLIFIYGQPGFHTQLKSQSSNPNERPKHVSMNAFYTYQLHPRPKA